jgi:hypothetical protein
VGEAADDRIIFPAGLDWDTAHDAVKIIQDWELRADGLAIELVVQLFNLLLAARVLTAVKGDKGSQ